MHMRLFHIISYERQDFRKKKKEITDHYVCVGFLCNFFSETFLILSRIERDMIK